MDFGPEPPRPGAGTPPLSGRRRPVAVLMVKSTGRAGARSAQPTWNETGVPGRTRGGAGSDYGGAEGPRGHRVETERKNTTSFECGKSYGFASSLETAGISRGG